VILLRDIVRSTEIFCRWLRFSGFLLGLGFRRTARKIPARFFSLGSFVSLLPVFMLTGKPCPLGETYVRLKPKPSQTGAVTSAKNFQHAEAKT
jgi:hypothetical protein